MPAFLTVEMPTSHPTLVATQPVNTMRNLVLLTLAIVWAHTMVVGGLPQSLGWLPSVQEPSTGPGVSFSTRSVLSQQPTATPAAGMSTELQRATAGKPVPAVTPSGVPPAQPSGGYRPQSKELAPIDASKAALAPTPAEEAAQAATENTAAMEPQAQQKPQVPQPEHPARLAASAHAVPSPVRIQYDIRGEVKGLRYSANAELVWLRDGNTYDARLEISHFLLGSRIQTSKGLISAQGLEPIRFGDKVRSEVAAHFVRDKGKVVFSANTPDVELQPGAQDQLSVLLQISTLLGSDPTRYTRGTQLPFQAIGPRRAENWVFTAGEIESIALENGNTTGLKFTRPPTGEFEPRLEVWFGPSAEYLPVRVRLTQSNGDFVDQLWRGAQKP